MILQTRGARHRLWLPDPIRPGQRVGAVLGIGRRTPSEAVPVLRFRADLLGITGPPGPTGQSPAKRKRLVRALQAFDARAAGASQRDIAAAIWGEERVAREFWPRSPLRAAVARLLSQADHLVRGGYLRLLKHG